MWTVYMTDKTARSVRSLNTIDLHCPQKLLVSSAIRKEIIPLLPECYIAKRHGLSLLKTSTFPRVYVFREEDIRNEFLNMTLSGPFCGGHWTFLSRRKDESGPYDKIHP